MDLKFSMTLKTTSKHDFISGMEKTTQNVPEKHPQKLCIRSKVILDNLSKLNSSIDFTKRYNN